MSTPQPLSRSQGQHTLTDLNRREWLSIGTAALGRLLPFHASGKPGADRIRLSLNENPFGPSPLALRAFRTFSKIYGLAGLAIGYTLAPRELAASLKQSGIGAFYNLNRLSLAAANASLKDIGNVASVRAQVATERDAWHELFRRRNLRFAHSRANFVFFDAGRPHEAVAAALTAQGIDIGRAYPLLETWVRISIGLPSENAIARHAVAALLDSH